MVPGVPALWQTQDVAKRTYFEFVKAGFVTPEAILRAGWDNLVEVLDRGHYVRYDFSSATKLLDICKSLTERYGSLTKLIEQARSQADLGRRLQSFKGVGPVTARIFLRDLKLFWRRRHGLKSQVPVPTLKQGRSRR